jgi:hypothetical protein
MSCVFLVSLLPTVPSSSGSLEDPLRVRAARDFAAVPQSSGGGPSGENPPTGRRRGGGSSAGPQLTAYALYTVVVELSP